MLDFRQVDHSVRKKVSELFTNPTADLPEAWNVYDEDDFSDEAFLPTAPYVFLLESRARPRSSRLPMVIIERGAVTGVPFEIGNVEGSQLTYNLHIFARNRGERGDLAAYLYKNLDSLALYDFSTEPEVLQYSVTLLGKFAVSNAVSADIGLEGALSNWESIGITFQTKSP